LSAAQEDIAMNQIDKNLRTEPLVPLMKDEEFSPEYRALMEQQRARSGRVTNSARASGHAAEMALVVRDYLSRMWTLGDLPKPFRALIRYKVSTTNTCLYCSTHQVEFLHKFGVDREKIANIYDYQTHPAFDERERAALAFVDAMMADASNIPDAVARRFVDNFTPQERVEIGYTATAMATLNKFNDAFRIPIEDEVVGVAIEVPDLAANKKGRAAL
jgi:alkylhydroperoxidase family enzyme